MPTTRVYRSTDAGAPALYRDAESLQSLLYACLDTGYGAQSGAGWTRSYTAAGKAVFKQGGGSGEYIRMLDDPGSGYASVACTGYETMSDVDTGTNPYPVVGAVTFTYMAPSSGIALPWTVVADDRTFYFYNHNPSDSDYRGGAFGDGYSYQSSGLYRTFLGATGYVRGTALPDPGADTWFTPRNHLGVYNATDRPLSLIGDTAKGVSGLLKGTVPYPHGPDNKIWLAPLELVDHLTPAIRMRLRGMWHWLHDTAAVADADVFDGVGDMVGKNFLIVRNVFDGSAYRHVVVHETSSTWDTN